MMQWLGGIADLAPILSMPIQPALPPSNVEHHGSSSSRCRNQRTDTHRLSAQRRVSVNGTHLVFCVWDLHGISKNSHALMS